MTDLFTYLKSQSNDSDFKAELSIRGGFITFSNSGRRGGVKYFQIGLDNIIQTLKDIHAHLDIFKQITDYDETPWRNNGSLYFEDAVANANSTVQTKPLFSTLSKVIKWANQPNLENIDPDKRIDLSEQHLIKTIEKLEDLADSFKPRKLFTHYNIEVNNSTYRPYITAIKSKPFLLLAGISGTGKSRIVRELARACWDEDSEEFKAQKPKNFEMIQVKPNWHDSSELIGYVSRINGERYVVGPFLRFLVKAIQNLQTPHFLCLDEMNLAPVEQYFAEYLSVIESRKVNADGVIVTDPIVDFEQTDAYKSLIDQLFTDDEERKAYLTEEKGKRLSLPANLIVIGTVNMDETTFSFSRKVLDRAMTIEMNEVDLDAGLTERYEHIGKLGYEELIGTAVEGVDVYSDNREVCDKALNYLKVVNAVLEGTPFKVAYRTRNEFLLYVVNNLPYNKDEEGNELPDGYVVARALDEVTNMKILSRIEGDDTKVTDSLLDNLKRVITEELANISDGFPIEKSVSLKKLDEMKQRLSSGYTSFWS